MKRSTDDARVPGATLLKIAPRLFSEPFMAAVVRPTIADLQSEVAAAGTNRVGRLRALWRGYFAFWTLTLAAPFATWAIPPAGEGNPNRSPAARLTVVTAVVILLAVIKTTLGGTIALVTAAGAVFAILIHAWYERHPTDVAAPAEPPARTPQINFSSTEVPSNVGGLIFVVGTLVIVSIGLPWVIWFLAAATAGGCVLAWRLAEWHTRHPKRGLPQNRIVLR